MGQETMVIAIETSSRIGSVALADGSTLWDQVTFSAPLRHSAEILPTIARLLHHHGHRPDHIRHVYISVGPGSFTGLRIAVTIAKALHLAHRSRIVAVDALDVIAANVDDAASALLFQAGTTKSPGIDRIAVLLDAKRGQFFVAVYEWAALHTEASPATPSSDDPGYRIPGPRAGTWRKILPDSLMSAAALRDRFADPARPIGVLGDGLLFHQDKFTTDGMYLLDAAYWSPSAAKVHRLGYQKAQAGLFSDPLTLVPFYLRGPQVTLKAKS